MPVGRKKNGQIKSGYKLTKSGRVVKASKKRKTKKKRKGARRKKKRQTWDEKYFGFSWD